MYWNYCDTSPYSECSKAAVIITDRLITYDIETKQEYLIPIWI